jgi:hypothetical protein
MGNARSYFSSEMRENVPGRRCSMNIKKSWLIRHWIISGFLFFLKDEIDQWVQMAPGKKLEEIENELWDKESLRSINGKPSKDLKSSIKYN